MKKRTLSITSITIGIILIINSQASILGAVIGLKEISSTASLIIGLVFLIVGVGMFFGRRGTKEIKLPSNIEEIIKKSGVLETDLVIVPDTEFIKHYLHEKGIGKRVRINMSGYKLILLPQVLKECRRKNVPIHITNYLASTHVDSEIVPEQEVSESDEREIKSAWREYTAKQGHPHRYQKEIKKILDGADSKLISYGIARGRKPTLILSDDTHLREISPIINRRTKSNIKVYRLKDYLESVA